jgi:hypothetical protein
VDFKNQLGQNRMMPKPQEKRVKKENNYFWTSLTLVRFCHLYKPLNNTLIVNVQKFVILVYQKSKR